LVALPRTIKIETDATGEIIAELCADRNRRTADEIWNALPMTARASRWGDEIYFAIPVNLPEEDVQETVQVGDIAYWPPGSAFCIFFGKTPASNDDRPRAASPVNVFGRILGDTSALKRVRDGDKVSISRAS
jgi:hypothetical protein